MKKLDKQVINEIDLVNNEYYITQNQVRSQFQILIKQRNMAIYFAIFIMILSFVICFKALLISQEAKKVDKIVFKEDGIGGITYVGIVNNTLKVNENKYLANQLVEYLYALYSVPLDDDTKKRNVAKVQMMTDVNYYNNIKQIMKDLYIKGENVSVKLSLVTKISNNLYSIDWDKFINNVNVGSYKTLIAFKQIQVQDETQQILQYNPLDIIITNIQTDQRIKI